MTGRAVSVAVRIVLWVSLAAAIVLVGANATDVLNITWMLPAAAVFIAALTVADKWCDRYQPTKPAVDWARVAELEHDTGIYDLYTHAEEAGDVCHTCDDNLVPPKGGFNTTYENVTATCDHHGPARWEHGRGFFCVKCGGAVSPVWHPTIGPGVQRWETRHGCAEGHDPHIADACRACVQERRAEIRSSQQRLSPGEFLIPGGALGFTYERQPAEPRIVCRHVWQQEQNYRSRRVLYQCIRCRARRLCYEGASPYDY